MYINFQQNRVSRSVKTVCTNLFAKKSLVFLISNKDEVGLTKRCDNLAG